MSKLYEFDRKGDRTLTKVFIAHHVNDTNTMLPFKVGLSLDSDFDVVSEGSTGGEETQTALESADKVIVFWSTDALSAGSPVRAQADYARRENKLIGIKIDPNVQLPLDFLREQFIDATGDTPSERGLQMKRLLAWLSPESASTDDTKTRVFISYRRQNREIALGFADALSTAGYSVWWDENLNPGEDWSDQLQREIDGSDVVLVLWTKEATEKDKFVGLEVEYAIIKNKLIALHCEPVELPVSAGRVKPIPFFEWEKMSSHPNWDTLIDSIERTSRGETKDQKPLDLPSLLVTPDWQYRFVPAPSPTEHWDVANVAKTKMGDPNEGKGLFTKLMSSAPKLQDKLKSLSWGTYPEKKVAGNFGPEVNSLLAVVVDADHVSGDKLLGVTTPVAAALEHPTSYFYSRLSRPPATETSGASIFKPMHPSSRKFLYADWRRALVWGWDLFAVAEFRREGDAEEHAYHYLDPGSVWPKLETGRASIYNGDLRHDLYQFLEASPDGSHIVEAYGRLGTDTLSSGGTDWRVVLWKADREWDGNNTYHRVHEFDLDHNGATHLKWSPTGRFFTMEYRQDTFQLYDIETLTAEKIEFYGKKRGWGRLAWHPQKDLLAQFFFDDESINHDTLNNKRIEIIDAQTTLTVAKRDVPHSQWGICVAWSPDGRYIASAGADAIVVLWDLKEDNVSVLGSGADIVRELYFSPDGQRLAIQDLGREGEISIWDHVNGVELARWRGSFKYFDTTPWHWEGQMIASSTDEHTVEVRKLGA